MTMIPTYVPLDQPADRHGPIRSVPAVRDATVLPRAVYRRRRIVLAAVVFLATVASVIGVGQASAQREFGPVEPETTMVIVQPGDTLWGIAERVAPEVDRREAVGRLVELAGGPSLSVGQRIEIPASLG